MPKKQQTQNEGKQEVPYTKSYYQFEPVRIYQGENMDVRHLDLKGKQIHDSNFRGANLAEMDLTRTRAMDVDFREANLRGTNLEGATLYRADLRDADMTNANLDGALFYNTNFEGASLKGANFTAGAPLKHMKNADLAEVNVLPRNTVPGERDAALLGQMARGGLKKLKGKLKETESSKKLSGQYAKIAKKLSRRAKPKAEGRKSSTRRRPASKLKSSSGRAPSIKVINKR